MNNPKENWNYQGYLEDSKKNSTLRAGQTEEQNSTNFIKMKWNFSTTNLILLIFTLHKTVESEQLDKAHTKFIAKIDQKQDAYLKQCGSKIKGK